MRRAPRRSPVAAAALTLGGLVLAGPASAGAATAPPVNSVVPFGTTAVGANAVSNPNAPIVGMAATPDGGGYWVVGRDGGIYAYGDAGFHGSAGALSLNAPIVGMAVAPGGGGYWLVASDGGVFNYGTAGFFGSRGGQPLNAPIVGLAATHDGGGYWLVAADGGVFAYGDAAFHGSAGALSLNAPIVGMAAAPGGGGYWLVGRDGGIFNYGGAGFFGSTGSLRLNSPVVAMAAAPDGDGYWLAASDGGVFTYGTATYLGSLGGTSLPAPVVGLAATPDGAGYWLALGAEPLAGQVVGIDPGHNGLNYTVSGIIDQPVFNGTGYEPCDTTGTETASGYTEAQYNFNVATYLQSDLEAEGATVVLTRPNNDGVGPCVTTRAAIIDDAHADVAIDIHADGGPVDGRGFAVLEPVADGPNDGVVASSAAFAALLRNAFEAGTPMPVSTYDGVDGLQPRNNLAGLNLTTVPKVLIECGNMQNPTDAAILETPQFQQQAAAAMATAITEFLTGHPA
jgi:N-acetylmuramoyl-L-alanine amidase